MLCRPGARQQTGTIVLVAAISLTLKDVSAKRGVSRWIISPQKRNHGSGPRLTPWFSVTAFFEAHHE
jgi:hypothetical protein